MRQRTIGDAMEVARYWAEGSYSPVVRNKQGNFYRTWRDLPGIHHLWSYGSHFCLGARHAKEDGSFLLVLNRQTYSHTTSRHQGWARRAADNERIRNSGCVGVIETHLPLGRADDWEKELVGQLKEQVSGYKYKRLEWTKHQHLLCIQETIRQFKTILLWLNQPDPFSRDQELSEIQEKVKAWQVTERLKGAGC